MYDVRCCSWAVPLELEVVARTEAFLVINLLLLMILAACGKGGRGLRWLRTLIIYSNLPMLSELYAGWLLAGFSDRHHSKLVTTNHTPIVRDCVSYPTRKTV